MFWVYIIENPLGRLYIGQTDNLEDRVSRHNRGGDKFTSHKGPWKLVYKENFETRSEALERERYLKSLKSSKYIKAYIIK